MKDSRLSHDKVSAKAAKEMYEHALKLESEYRHYISGMFVLLIIKCVMLFNTMII